MLRRGPLLQQRCRLRVNTAKSSGNEAVAVAIDAGRPAPLALPAAASEVFGRRLLPPARLDMPMPMYLVILTHKSYTVGFPTGLETSVVHAALWLWPPALPSTHQWTRCTVSVSSWSSLRRPRCCRRRHSPAPARQSRGDRGRACRCPAWACLPRHGCKLCRPGAAC